MHGLTAKERHEAAWAILADQAGDIRLPPVPAPTFFPQHEFIMQKTRPFSLLREAYINTNQSW